MDLATTLAAGPGLTPATAPGADKRPVLLRLAAVATVSALLWGASLVWFHEPYRPGSTLGYNLGLVGGVLMLLLLPYSLRKRLRGLRQFGTMRVWFLFHIFAGLVGPLLVLFHSTFRIGSFNGGIALASTLLVTFSGMVGRFFYRKIHRGLSGSRATLGELEAALNQQMATLQPQLERLPVVAREARRYLARAANPSAERWQRTAHFLALGGQRLLVRHRIRRALLTGRDEAASGAGELNMLLQTIDATLVAAQRTAQFSTYERLFALWHVIHIPFLYLLILTSVVHVVAVHAY